MKTRLYIYIYISLDSKLLEGHTDGSDYLYVQRIYYSCKVKAYKALAT